MLAKIVGPFHFSLSILGTEVMSLTLFTEEDQAVGMADWDEDDEDGDDPDPTDTMLDTLNEIVRWEGGEG